MSGPLAGFGNRQVVTDTAILCRFNEAAVPGGNSPHEFLFSILIRVFIRGARKCTCIKSRGADRACGPRLLGQFQIELF